jgi:hypothetical protein
MLAGSVLKLGYRNLLDRVGVEAKINCCISLGKYDKMNMGLYGC